MKTDTGKSLLLVAAEVTRRRILNLAANLPNERSQSGRGQPHSKTLSRPIARCSVREVLECGCPLPLSVLTPAQPHYSVHWPHAAPNWSLGSPAIGEPQGGADVGNHPLTG